MTRQTAAHPWQDQTQRSLIQPWRSSSGSTHEAQCEVPSLASWRCRRDQQQTHRPNATTRSGACSRLDAGKAAVVCTGVSASPGPSASKWYRCRAAEASVRPGQEGQGKEDVVEMDHPARAVDLGQSDHTFRPNLPNTTTHFLRYLIVPFGLSYYTVCSVSVCHDIWWLLG